MKLKELVKGSHDVGAVNLLALISHLLLILTWVFINFFWIFSSKHELTYHPGLLWSYRENYDTAHFLLEHKLYFSYHRLLFPVLISITVG